MDKTRRPRGGQGGYAGVAGVAAGFFLLVCPVAAQAHNSLPGMGEFVNGFAHPLVTPAHLLLLICLGVMLGQRPPLRLALPLSLFALSSAVALACTATIFIKSEPPAILACISLAAAILIATALPIPQYAMGILFVLAGVALGLDSVADAATTPWGVTKTLFGTWISFLVWIVDIAYYVSLLPPRKWLQIAVRVVGSWVVAISFLILAFALKR